MTTSVSCHSDLANRIAQVFPRNVKATVRHISTTPTLCDPLFAAPQGEYPEVTFRESHFLSISVNIYDEEVIVIGIEALVYTTARLTTIFVSKADSRVTCTDLSRMGRNPR